MATHSSKPSYRSRPRRPNSECRSASMGEVEARCGVTSGARGTPPVLIASLIWLISWVLEVHDWSATADLTAVCCGEGWEASHARGASRRTNGASHPCRTRSPQHLRLDQLDHSSQLRLRETQAANLCVSCSVCRMYRMHGLLSCCADACM